MLRPEDDELVLDVLGSDRYDELKALDRKKLPIIFEGRQVRSLESLRVLLRQHSRPDQLHDEQLGPIDAGRTKYASRKSLLIRCESSQDCAWVRALLTIATIVPDRDPAVEIAESPLIHRIALATADGRRFPLRVPIKEHLADAIAEQPLDEVRRMLARDDRWKRYAARLVLYCSMEDYERPPFDRKVRFYRGGSNACLGEYRNTNNDPNEAPAWKLEPPDTFSRLEGHLKETKAMRSPARVRIDCGVRVPWLHAIRTIDVAFGIEASRLELEPLDAKTIEQLESEHLSR